MEKDQACRIQAKNDETIPAPESSAAQQISFISRMERFSDSTRRRQLNGPAVPEWNRRRVIGRSAFRRAAL
jgi:hypothetical protein